MYNTFHYNYFLKTHETILVNNQISSNIKLPELKSIGKLLHVKVTQKKQDLLNSINQALTHHKSSVILQKMIRGYFVRKWISLHGPVWKNVSNCNNVNDFLSMEEISSIHPFQVFSYKDNEGFIYAFNLISFTQLIQTRKHRQELCNPYNKNVISKKVIELYKKLILYSKLLHIPIMLEEPETIYDESPEKRVLRRSCELFHVIDSLGNYSDSKWFTDLDFRELKLFIRELYDIWSYRAMLPNETKQLICPHQDPFFTLHYLHLHNPESAHPLTFYQNAILDILFKLTTSGVNQSSQALGAFYVLGALTLVNREAAEAIPWLYDSVRLNN